MRRRLLHVFRIVVQQIFSHDGFRSDLLSNKTLKVRYLRTTLPSHYDFIFWYNSLCIEVLVLALALVTRFDCLDEMTLFSSSQTISTTRTDLGCDKATS